jgi:hypothetical protein
MIETKYLTDINEITEVKQLFQEAVDRRVQQNSGNKNNFNNEPVAQLLFYEALNYKGEEKNIGEMSRKSSVNYIHFLNPVVTGAALLDNPINSFSDSSYEWGGKEYSYNGKS